MDKKTKRILALVSVVALIIISLASGTLKNKELEQLQPKPEDYMVNILNNEKSTTYVARVGDMSQVIQKISIDGTIDSSMTNRYSKNSVINQIKQAKENDNVKAILLSINSPGGGVYESAELYRELKNSGKDIYVSMKNIAASGGYYISAPAKKIYANEETITGSIGVVMRSVSAQKFFNDHGIEEEVLRTGDLKAVGGTFENLTPEAKKMHEEQMQASFDKFVSIVADGRHMTVDEVKKVADGRTFRGNQAVEAGLVDKIGTEDELIDYIKEDKGLSNPQVQEIRVDKNAGNFLSSFFKTMVKSMLVETKNEIQNNEMSYLAR